MASQADDVSYNPGLNLSYLKVMCEIAVEIRALQRRIISGGNGHTTAKQFDGVCEGSIRTETAREL